MVAPYLFKQSARRHAGQSSFNSAVVPYGFQTERGTGNHIGSKGALPDKTLRCTDVSQKRPASPEQGDVLTFGMGRLRTGRSRAFCKDSAVPSCPALAFFNDADDGYSGSPCPEASVRRPCHSSRSMPRAGSDSASPAAIHVERCAFDVGAEVRGEESRNPADFHRLSEAPHADPIEDITTDILGR